MRSIAFLSLAAFAAGCSESGGAIQAGNWETKSTLAGATRTMTRCISEPEASDPMDGLLRTATWSQCQVQESRFSGGEISAHATCTGFTQAVVPSAVSRRISLAGTYTPTSIEGRISSTRIDQQDAPTETGTVAARRIGDCPA
jgi:hypothetical protein